jgi:hypothetical protein
VTYTICDLITNYFQPKLNVLFFGGLVLFFFFYLIFVYLICPLSGTKDRKFEKISAMKTKRLKSGKGLRDQER